LARSALHPHAIAVSKGCAGVEEARCEADARTDEQRRRERDERERRRRLANRRAALSEEMLETLKHRAEEALATEGFDRTHLGYDVLVKLKMDDLLERQDLAADMSASEGNPGTTGMGSSIFWETHQA
jgi:Asp-tRNA(Asn)/Glu-tRNA(Gln) amidotransferase A subunit family amidase